MPGAQGGTGRPAAAPGPLAEGPARRVLLTGKTLGIVGADRIGSPVGELGAAWGMRVIGCVADATPATQAGLAARGITMASFDTVRKAAAVDPHIASVDHIFELVRTEEAIALEESGS